MQLASLYLSYIPKKRLMSWLFFALLTFLLLLQVMVPIATLVLLSYFELRLAVHFTILI